MSLSSKRPAFFIFVVFWGSVVSTTMIGLSDLFIGQLDWRPRVGFLAFVALHVFCVVGTLRRWKAAWYALHLGGIFYVLLLLVRLADFPFGLLWFVLYIVGGSTVMILFFWRLRSNRVRSEYFGEPDLDEVVEALK